MTEKVAGHKTTVQHWPDEEILTPLQLIKHCGDALNRFKVVVGWPYGKSSLYTLV